MLCFNKTSVCRVSLVTLMAAYWFYLVASLQKLEANCPAGRYQVSGP